MEGERDIGAPSEDAAHADCVSPHEPRGKMPDDPAKQPRFPYVAALLCVACVGAAVWTWMRYPNCSECGIRPGGL